MVGTGDASTMLGGVRSRIKTLVEQYCAEPSQRDGMLHALARPGFALHPEAPCRGGLLTLLVGDAITGSPDGPSVEAAAGVELQMAAASMFDHLADQETDPEDGFSDAEEIALAIAVLMCGTAAASQAMHQALGNCPALPSLLRSYSSIIDACGGQFLDAHLKKRDGVAIDEALTMTTLKAGSLGRFAAEFGASVSTRDEETVAGFGEFGFNLLTYVQLIDDLKDSCSEDSLSGDIWRNQKTVPLVFFYNYMAERHPLLRSGRMLPRDWQKTIPSIRREFEASGAQLFCALMAETFLNRAKGQIEQLRPRVATLDRIEDFVESLEIDPQGIFAAS